MADYNIIAVGGGSAGLVTAYIAAAVKAKVALIERNKMGGDCLNYGCVPSKALIRSSRFVADMRRAAELGIKSVTFDFDFADIMDRVHEVIRKIEPHDSIERYQSLGVDCITGQAEILDANTIRVGDRKLTTKNIVLALGASPFVPEIQGLDQVKYRTSENLWEMRTLPMRLVILGGGPIGCEMVQAFARFGSQVTQVEMAPRILPREDDDVAELIADKFRREGVKLLTHATATKVVIEAGEKILICKSKNGDEIRVPFDEILVAVGRKANTANQGLERLGVALNPNGTIKVDDYLRTTVPNIYACGDVAGPYQFTHVAAHQAWFCAVNALFSPFKTFKVDYSVISWCTFTDPEVAQVGLNEQMAKARGIPYEVTKYGIDDLDRAIAESEDHGFVKVLTKPGTDKIIGCTIVSHLAGELIAEYVAAMKHGFGLNKILGTIHAYPTFVEANKYAAGVWKKAHAPQGLLKWVERFHSWRR